mmetsp:Transcript_18402/g.35007  ORF Transcript_18402/g.35007 Transcript_18402/m.35007 type:complete len:210 (+) Transcript_18402:1060-1689(+)
MSAAFVFGIPNFRSRLPVVIELSVLIEADALEDWPPFNFLKMNAPATMIPRPRMTGEPPPVALLVPAFADCTLPVVVCAADPEDPITIPTGGVRVVGLASGVGGKSAGGVGGAAITGAGWDLTGGVVSALGVGRESPGGGDSLANPRKEPGGGDTGSSGVASGWFGSSSGSFCTRIIFLGGASSGASSSHSSGAFSTMACLCEDFAGVS